MTRDDMSEDETGQDETGQEESREEEGVDGRTQAPATRGPQAGARLKAARQARNISLDEIARELHLDADKLRALESNRFEVFSAPVFTKGYLRRYAGLVGVSEDEVLAGFDELSDAAGPPPVVIKSPPARPRYVPSLQAVLLVLLAALLGLLGWWAFSGAVLKPVPEVAGDGAAEPLLPARGKDVPAGAAATTAGAAPSQPAEAAIATTNEEAADAASATVEPTPAPVARAADAVDADRGSPQSAPLSLTLSFSDECWLQVTDGDGERLYAGIARGGQVRRFSAVPPVSLVLGNADAASIEVDGEPYPIDPADRRGRTARITVPGS
ncbi:helix-turn-helix domain-containing protein [Lentisalinibacter salinarum]|uniref:helix-turn-helix domain-containing protein n=1 Tax=Lentisalinibacter salinarum TaxID=2992239 RepID=UPI00386DBB75